MPTTNTDNNRIYTGTNNTQYLIREPELGSGGEGYVYEVAGYPNYVLKVFKDHCCTPQREAKLLKMIQQKLTEEEMQQINWPIDVVYDEKGFAGYVMEKVTNNKNLNVIYSTKNQLDLRYRVVIAYNLCAAVDTVHSFGQICGDLNPQNILVDSDMKSPTALHVTLVDTDSFHIQDEDKVYRCEVGLATYLAPEIQKKLVNGATLRTAPLPTYTRETDLFALAVHVFCLLMNGCHPFACAKETNTGYQNDMEALNDKNEESVVLPQPIENIRDGFFPFIQGKNGITYPLYALDIKSLPQDIYHLFERAFVSGYNFPNNRPTAKEWLKVLGSYHGAEHYGKCVREHFYLNKNAMTCPFCDANRRMLEIMNGKGENFPSENKTSKSKPSENKPPVVTPPISDDWESSEELPIGASSLEGGNSTVDVKTKVLAWILILLPFLILLGIFLAENDVDIELPSYSNNISTEETTRHYENYKDSYEPYEEYYTD